MKVIFRCSPFLFTVVLLPWLAGEVMGSFLQCQLRSVDAYGAIVTFRTTTPNPGGEPYYFAFSSSPDAQSDVQIKLGGNQNGASFQSAVPVQMRDAFWVGAHFIQWVRFSLPYTAKSTSGEIFIRFTTPTYNNSNLSSIAIRNDMLLVPTIHKKLAKRRASPLPETPFRYGCRLGIDHDGIYELTGSMLRSLGVPISTINSRTYRLFYKGNEIPVYLPDAQHSYLHDNDRILFYARHLRGSNRRFTQYSNTAVYWLTWGNRVGVRAAHTSGAKRRNDSLYTTSQSSRLVRPREFRDTVHFEFDNDIRWLGSINEPEDIADAPLIDSALDNWYWGFIGTDELTEYKLPVPSPSPTSGTARLRIELMGLTSIDSEPVDHYLTVLLNGNAPGNGNIITWDGQKPHTFTSNYFPVSRLRHGTNTISFMRKPRGIIDRSALNSIALEYLRSYQALGNEFSFKNGENTTGKLAQYEIGGFSTDNLELWDIEKNRFFTGFEVHQSAGHDGAEYTLVFQDSTISNTRYLAQAKEKRRIPETISIDSVRTDWSSLHGVDYIVISVDSFRTVLQPLLDIHTERGLKTAFVDIQDIYNYFSCGIRDPESIRRFIGFLYALSPQSPPRYLLLGGDTTHDLDKKRRNRNIVPTHLTRIPGWGPGANDGYFAAVWGEDNIPDLYVGRFPAQNRAEMKILIDKTVDYIAHPNHGFWRDNLLLLAGSGSKGEHEFTHFNNQVETDIIGPLMNTIRMDADPASPFYKDEFSASKNIADHINAGVYVVNFNGHGGGNIWSDNRFFGYNDLSRLHNGQWGKSGKLPIIFSFTCLSGFFESAFYRSLGEEFIRLPNDGAVCFYGASAYTSREGNLKMNRLLLRYALHGSCATIGELLWLCEMNMIVRDGIPALPLVRQYNLLGDPALPWKLPPDTLQLALEKNALSGQDTLRIHGTCSPVQDGRLRLQIGTESVLWAHSFDTVKNGKFSKAYPFKPNASTADGLVRAYAWNDSDAVRGWVEFTKNTLLVYNTALTPPAPSCGDSISLRCSLAIPPGISGNPTVYCLYATVGPYTPDTVYQGIIMEHDTGSQWISSKKIRANCASVRHAHLSVYIRVTTGTATRESKRFLFPLRGRPDLTFTNDSLRLGWHNDSLGIPFQVLNMGNTSAPPFPTVLYWENHSTKDTVITVTTDSLPPGKIQNYLVPLPDTKGDIRFTAIINEGKVIPEIDYHNNSIGGSSQLTYHDLHHLSDTLVSPGKGVTISPQKQFSSPYRVFLFTKSTGRETPLRTESHWLPITGDSISSFTITCRPPLLSADSLVWNIVPDSSYIARIESEQTGKLAVIQFDSLLGSWHYASTAQQYSYRNFSFTTQSNVPYTIAHLSDVQSPDIAVSVYGRELTVVDYAAKNKPFNIFITDESGILPKTVSILSNGKAIGNKRQSSQSVSENGTTVRQTVYPTPVFRVDTLKVSAQDLAGNISARSFAYMPGEDLKIPFFACYPNPFSARLVANGTSSEQIRFAFILTDVAKDVSLTIFTVNGTKIRTWHFVDLIGYQEVEWDGRDREGFRLANGLYYAKLIVRNEQKKVKKILRIAKLEGY